MNDHAAASTEQAPTARMLSGRELKDLAESGQFSVDDSTGERMIQAFEDIVDALEERWSTIEKLARSPELSSTQTAQWVARHTVNTASDEQGLLTQLRQARAELPQYIEAIREAKRRYTDTDASTKSTLSDFHAQP
ncbi:hypothetical protein BJF85_08640 [Saccharomonospora sp. CUA-673]|uniref:hypothetical protein n=1 Tax=Saccharomonospora sp. CUA-673 TaxID=1904969 RepID=UPI0009658388|nr:hypothetical protein [Saccharomonospora sp. CUA-673]OLT38735.1 hypothetical protein BJF85_08640 [Saccharomonospora sp. CUA-673]